MKDIRNKNKNGKYHGYQERYNDFKLWFRYNANNGRFYGYYEWYPSTNKIGSLRFYIL